MRSAALSAHADCYVQDANKGGLNGKPVGYRRAMRHAHKGVVNGGKHGIIVRAVIGLIDHVGAPILQPEAKNWAQADEAEAIEAPAEIWRGPQTFLRPNAKKDAPASGV